MEETTIYYVLSALHILFHFSHRVTLMGRYYLPFTERKKMGGFSYLVNITDLMGYNK